MSNIKSVIKRQKLFLTILDSSMKTNERTCNCIKQIISQGKLFINNILHESALRHLPVQNIL